VGQKSLSKNVKYEAKERPWIRTVNRDKK